MNLFSKIMISALAATVSTSVVAGVVSDVGSVPDYAAEKADKDWSGMVGLVALSAPPGVFDGFSPACKRPRLWIYKKNK